MSIINKRNTFWNSISFIVISILGFINFTLNLRNYEGIVFGYYILLSSYWAIGSSIDLGFGVSTIKNISEAIKVKDLLGIKKIVNTFLLTYSFLGIVVASLVYTILLIYSADIGSDLNNEFDTNLLLVLFGFGFLPKYLSGFLTTVYEGLSEFVLISKLNLILSSLNTLLILFIYIYKLSLYYLVASQLIYWFIHFMCLILVLVFKNDYVSLGIKYIDLKLLKKLGMYNFNIQLSFALGSFIDPIMKSIINFSLGLQYVTFFETAKRIINLTNGLITSALKGMLNKLSEANAVGELKQFINEKIYIYSNLSLDYSIIVYGIFNPLICAFILIWFGSYESMIIFLVFLLPYTLINFGGPLYSIFFVDGKAFKLVLLQSINVILVSVFMYISFYITEGFWGFAGFYFSTIVNSYLMFYFLKKHIGFEPSFFWSKVKIRNIISINILIICQIILLILFERSIIIILIAFTIVYMILYRIEVKYYIGYIIKKVQNLLVNFK